MSGKRAKRLRGRTGEVWTRIPESTANLMESAAIYVVALKKQVKRRFRKRSYQQIINNYTCANRWVKAQYKRHRAKTGVSL